jgi:hypothetical protein
MKLLVQRIKQRWGCFPYIGLVAEVDGLAFALTVGGLFFGIATVDARTRHEDISFL